MNVRLNERGLRPGLLRRQSGITLMETLVVMLVIVVMVITIYIGIIYAERQLTTNYRDRAATLLLNGELEMEYYRASRSKPFELQVNKSFVLDDLDPDHVLRGGLTIQRFSAQESSNSQLLDYTYLLATIKWIDPYSKESRFITMREDYFIAPGGTGP